MTERGGAAATVERTLRKPVGFYWTRTIAHRADGRRHPAAEGRSSVRIPFAPPFCSWSRTTTPKTRPHFGPKSSLKTRRETRRRSLSCGTFHSVGVANLLVTFLDDRKPNERPLAHGARALISLESPGADCRSGAGKDFRPHSDQPNELRSRDRVDDATQISCRIPKEYTRLTSRSEACPSGCSSIQLALLLQCIGIWAATVPVRT